MKTVLFVSYDNAGRSQMAEAIFNSLATYRKLPFHAISAGTLAATELNPLVIDAMQMIGISMGTQQPKQLLQWHVDAADVIITMCCQVDIAAHINLVESETWEIGQPSVQTLPAVSLVRDTIASKVKGLVNRMSATPTAT